MQYLTCHISANFGLHRRTKQAKEAVSNQGPRDHNSGGYQTFISK